MHRDFVRHLILVIGINLLIKPFYIFGIDRTVQNIVGPEEYGQYFSLFNFVLLFQIVSDMGLQNFNNKSISEHPRSASYRLSIGLGLKTILGLLFFGAVLLVAKWAGYLSVEMSMLYWIAFNAFLVSMILFLRTFISGQGFYRLDSVLSALDKLVMIIIIGFWLITKTDFKIIDFIYGQTIGLAITLLIVLVLVLMKSPKIDWFWSWDTSKKLLTESLPYATVIIMMTIYTRIDSVMIERLLPDGDYQAGVYAAGYRILDAVNMIGFLTAGLLLPMFSRLRGQRESLWPLYRVAIVGASIISCFVTCSALIFKLEWTDLLYHDATPYWAEVFGILLLSFIPIGVGYVTGSLLTATGDIGKLIWLFAIAVVLNVVLNYFMIHSHKAYGAAIATLFTQGLVLIAQIFLVHRTQGYTFRRYPRIGMVGISIIIVASIMALRQFTTDMLIVGCGLGVIGSILIFALYKWIENSGQISDIGISHQ